MNQPEIIELFLENYHTFCISNDLESRYIILDIISAITKAELTDYERLIIQKLYIDEQEPPRRDNLAKNGHTNGRPPGGTTQTAVGIELHIEKSTLSVIKKTAIQKIADVLGDGYYEPTTALRPV